ncbi:MAG: ABC transporter permease, partial [Flavobacteriales bacterium]
MNRWLREIGYALLILWGVVTAVFFLFNLAPGDPVRNLVGENASAETVANMRRKYDLDLSLMHRYVLYLNDLSPVCIYGTTAESRPLYAASEHGGYAFAWGDKALVFKWPYLKRSFLSDKPVSDLLMEAMPGTMLLALVSILLSLMLGIPMGIAAALAKDSITDRVLLVLSSLGMAGPSFFVAMLVAWLGAVLWRDEIHLGYHWLILLIAAVLLQYFKSGFIRRHGF